MWTTLCLALVGLLAIGLTGAFLWMVLLVASERSAHSLGDWLACVVMGGSAAMVCLLANYVAHDLRGKWRGFIAVNNSHLELDLAAHRSLIHAPPRIVTHIALADVEAIETRLESYSKWGMAEIQRSFRLCLRGGDSILLFEQRALGTNQQSTDMDGLADSLAQRLDVPLRDVGMVEGRLGFLGIIGGEAAAWNTSPLTPERESAMIGRAILTGALPALAMMATLLIKALVVIGNAIF